MSKVTSIIQETMQKGRAIVSDRKLGKEGYARLGEIYGLERLRHNPARRRNFPHPG